MVLRPKAADRNLYSWAVQKSSKIDYVIISLRSLREFIIAEYWKRIYLKTDSKKTLLKDFYRELQDLELKYMKNSNHNQKVVENIYGDCPR